MARGKNLNRTQKVQPTVSDQMMGYLQQLVDLGSYGNTPTAAALYLLQRGVDDMLRARLLRPAKKRRAKR